MGYSSAMQPDLRYPIGEFVAQPLYSSDETKQHIMAIAHLPAKLTALVGNWPDDRLDTPYRPGGWTVRQLVHHIADSHINGYIRTKLALTETNPTVRPYHEGEWARLPDSGLDIAPSLVLLNGVHRRWATTFEALSEAGLQRTFYHSGSDKTFTLAQQAANYAWHGEHHYQHASQLARRNGWL